MRERREGTRYANNTLPTIFSHNSFPCNELNESSAKLTTCIRNSFRSYSSTGTDIFEMILLPGRPFSRRSCQFLFETRIHARERIPRTLDTKYIELKHLERKIEAGKSIGKGSRFFEGQTTLKLPRFKDRNKNDSWKPPLCKASRALTVPPAKFIRSRLCRIYVFN